MKNKKIIILLLLTTLIISFILISCNKKDNSPNIVSIDAKLESGVQLKVGDVFDTTKIKVTAKLSDDTERALKSTSTAALEFDLKELELDDNNKMTKSGKFTIVITFSDFNTTLEVNILA